MPDLQFTAQQLAILAHDPQRHARILASPGTGKSTTMVALLDRLLEQDNVIRAKMLTFTRAATAELAEKVQTQSSKAVRPSTIHSFAITILLRNPGAGGFPEPLRIADVWESNKVVYPTLAKRVGVSVTRLVKLIRKMAANWQSLTEEIDTSITENKRKRFLVAWAEHRKILAYTLLDELPYTLCNALHNYDDLDGIDYEVLLVDEYQDLNACDLEVIRLISEKGGSTVIATGDDDQSIYLMRNAAPEGIQRFLDDYVPADDYSLSFTLRCGKRIVEWANHVISGDPDRPVDKGVLSCLVDAPEGEVALLSFENHKSEASGIAQLVKGLIQCEGLKPSDILILIRSDYKRAFSQPIREQLERVDIPSSNPEYVHDLLENAQNRKLIEVLRLLVYREDSISWASVLKLTLGIGTTFFNHIYCIAKDKGSTFATELLGTYNAGFPNAPKAPARRARETIHNVLDWIDARSAPDETPEGGWGRWIIDSSGGLVAPAPTEKFADLLLELDQVSDENQSLKRFLTQIEPLGKDLARAKSEGVRIMTITGAKGLTVRATVIAGVENGLVPRPDGTLSEERRILYVAMTRPREYLYCTWAKQRLGPTARHGKPSIVGRTHSYFFDAGPVQSQDGEQFVRCRF
jgi:DNA helicase-2/ATP-dependent DNA helicase PcrA